MRNGTGFGLYIHWPFCESKCPYCDFNSHVAARIDQDAWRRAYESEIARAAAETSGRTLDSIFFGGGTPSLMPPDTVAAILKAARSAWPWSNQVEITLEANPGSVEVNRFRAFRDAGINRISIGVQALNDDDLRRLGRMHSATDARRALDTAMSVFDRVSFDLIYARQDQTLAAWRSELQQALAIGTGHLSLYQLTIEDGTVFAERHARNLLRGLPDEDLAADMFDLTQTLTGEAGLPPYEISNHARPGEESRHNLLYWNCGDYVGIGPGAHGRLTLSGRRIATEAHRNPSAWLVAAKSSGGGESLRSALSPADAMSEALLMGLRVDAGIEVGFLNSLGYKLAGNAAVEQLTSDGLITVTDGRFQTTQRGRPLLNAILAKLLS